MAIFDACRNTSHAAATVKVDANMPSTAPTSSGPAKKGTVGKVMPSFVSRHMGMPSKVLILNAGEAFAMAQGKLNAHLADKQFTWFTANGAAVKLIHLANVSDMTPQDHIANIQWADLIVFQFPLWWSNVSNSLKNFFDVVYTASYGTLVQGDGRSPTDPSKKFGSGGCCQGKHYMLSFTCNTPLEAFDDPVQFYNGLGVERSIYHVHSPNLFLGMTPVSTFSVHDIYKDKSEKGGFDLSKEEERLEEHLKKIFKKRA